MGDVRNVQTPVGKVTEQPERRRKRDGGGSDVVNATVAPRENLTDRPSDRECVED